MNDTAAAPPSEPDLGLGGGESGGGESGGAYRVLARKYRPARFADLIGQEALVRTLSNAIRSGRVAHAFVLTGVRGVGKTTTARILARALNCVGPDGTGGPTDDPCGVCEHCRAIADDRHVDVIEMDAASRTGIDDIRELIEGVRYRPVSARNKVYIIDEVHMLSRQAFNGLLKTLEEPPEHVVFVFATTEIRKVPVTVLSRCQRFDLRRVEQAELAGYFAEIAKRESVGVSEEALAMIARAADGSVRDGLSLLDQAIALSGAGPEAGGEAGAVSVEAGRVREMLGLADRSRGLDLFEAVMTGEIAAALEILGEMHAVGADPAVLLEDLLELTHLLTRIKLTPSVAEDPATPEAERTRGRALAESLEMASLARAWQILLKGLGETRAAPHPLQAAEMVLIRLAHASDLPSPADLIRRLEGAPQAGGASGGETAPSGPPSRTRAALEAPPVAAEPPPQPPAEPPPVTEAPPPIVEAPAAMPESFEAVVALARAKGEKTLASHLEHDVRPVDVAPPVIRMQILESAPPRLAPQLQKYLKLWTGRDWTVEPSQTAGVESLHEARQAAEAAERASAEQDPLVQAVKEAFPGADLVEVRRPGASSSDAAAAKTDGDEDQDRGTGTR